MAGAFAVLVWGVHPLRVESVAWITERRDVLCGLFSLLTVLAYLKSLERGEDLRRPIWRALSLAAFAAALLSKAAAMPMPAVLLLLDVHPLRRWDAAGWRRLAIEKLPYAALAAGTAVVALIALPRGVVRRSRAYPHGRLRLSLPTRSSSSYRFVCPRCTSCPRESTSRVGLFFPR
jgi:hypothetical protein